MSIVISLPRGGDGENWIGTGQVTHRGVGNSPVHLVFTDVVVENFLASAKKGKQECPVQAVHIKICSNLCRIKIKQKKKKKTANKQAKRHTLTQKNIGIKETKATENRQQMASIDMKQALTTLGKAC